MENEPLAGAGSDVEKQKLRTIIERRGLAGAANDTKWNELITYMRKRDGWRPSYRYKWIEGHISSWDVDWWYHLPFPFLGVEWLDIGLHQEVRVGRLVKNKIIDHSGWILSKLQEIGFEYAIADDTVRIFGYLPKSYECFPPNKA